VRKARCPRCRHCKGCRRTLDRRSHRRRVGYLAIWLKHI
jgi:hypothetical protein